MESMSTDAFRESTETHHRHQERLGDGRGWGAWGIWCFGRSHLVSCTDVPGGFGTWRDRVQFVGEMMSLMGTCSYTKASPHMQTYSGRRDTTARGLHGVWKHEAWALPPLLNWISLSRNTHKTRWCSYQLTETLWPEAHQNREAMVPYLLTQCLWWLHKTEVLWVMRIMYIFKCVQQKMHRMSENFKTMSSNLK